jgi:hypothetical protein
MSFVFYAVVALLFLVYKLLTAKNDYFEKKGIPFTKPKFIVGSRWDLIVRNRSMPKVVTDWYNEFRDAK